MADDSSNARNEAYNAVLKQVAERAESAANAATLLDLAKAYQAVVHGNVK